MTLDEAVALSLVPNLTRVGLTDRLRAADPTLLERASELAPRARVVRLRAAEAGIRVLAWNDPRFPAALLDIPDAPPALWYRGSLDALRRPAVAVVGSRTASAVALEIAARLGADLASLGIAVVSGLARGVDSAAHRGALGAGCTVAVLGSGVDRVYPPEHAALARDITGAGTVLSEYAPGTAPLAFHFPMRNRLISGLSRAVVVVEASDRSGSLITAACALEQGRDVMAVPGNALSGRNRGAHALIRDGARIVESAADVVEELGWHGAPAAADREPRTGDGPPVDDPLLLRMRQGEAYSLDELQVSAGLAAEGLLPRLLELELRGLVQRVGGGRFMRPTRTC